MRTHCAIGHDLRKPGAAYRDGRCRVCKHAYMDSIRADATQLEHDPKRVPKTRCKRGHDLTKPGARYPSGGCKRCQIARLSATSAPKPKAPKRVRGESPDHVAAAINRRLLEITDELDIAPTFRSRELKEEMARLVRRRDSLLMKGGSECDS